MKLEGRRAGIPHLAKNERDMGHPAVVVGTENCKTLRSVHSILDLQQASQPLDDKLRLALSSAGGCHRVVEAALVGSRERDIL